MTGRRRFHAVSDELEKRTKAAFEPEVGDEVQPTTLDFVCYWIESGRTMKALAKELEDCLPFDVDYGFLMRHLYKIYGDSTVDQRIDAARTKSADVYAEESLDITDERAQTPMDVNRNASRARSRQWLAEKWNAGKYGQKAVTVQVSIGELHLNALRQVAAEKRQNSTLSAIGEARLLPAGEQPAGQEQQPEDEGGTG